MEECVAVAVAEAVTVAVAEAVAKADESIHDQVIHHQYMDDQSSMSQSCGRSVLWTVSPVDDQSCGRSVLWTISPADGQS